MFRVKRSKDHDFIETNVWESQGKQDILRTTEFCARTYTYIYHFYNKFRKNLD